MTIMTIMTIMTLAPSKMCIFAFAPRALSWFVRFCQQHQIMQGHWQSPQKSHLDPRGMVDYLGYVVEETKSKAVYAMGVAF